jgi:hypothetical protein
MSKVQVLYWQDIPSVVKSGDEKRQLPDWFQQEIDRVAMEQGLYGSDAYLEQWEWRDHPGESLDAVYDELASSAT